MNHLILLQEVKKCIEIKEWAKVVGTLLPKLIYNIASTELKIPNILDKHKYREVEIANLLGHRVSVQSCAIQLPDAMDYKFNACEYKTQNVKKPKKSKDIKIKGIYSSANKIDNIKRALKTRHYFAAYVDGKLWFIVHVSSQEVYNQLNKSFQRRRARDSQYQFTDRKIPKDDNWNEVSVNVNILVEKTNIYDIKYLNSSI